MRKGKMFKRARGLLLTMVALIGLVGCGNDYFKRVREEFQDVPFTTVIFNDNRREVAEKMSEYENMDKNGRLKYSMGYKDVEFGGIKGNVLITFDQKTDMINGIDWYAKNVKDDKLYEELTKQAEEMYGQPFKYDHEGTKMNLYRINGDNSDIFMISYMDEMLSISRDRSGKYNEDLEEIYGK